MEPVPVSVLGSVELVRPGWFVVFVESEESELGVEVVVPVDLDGVGK